jgi:acyl-CoA synthetase (AMP-forming)/AMP-acid ligase II
MRPKLMRLNSLYQLNAASLLVASVYRFGEKIALRSANEVRTYAQLGDRTSRMAQGLLNAGIHPGDRIVLMAPNGIQFIEAWWGIIRAGAVVMPINSLATQSELLNILETSEASGIIISSKDQISLCTEIRARFPKVIIIANESDAKLEILALESVVQESSQLEIAINRALDDPCAIYFTAGSTGHPKGIIRSNQSVVWGLGMLARTLSSDDILLARAPMAHTGGSLTGPFAILVAGGSLIIPSNTSVECVIDEVQKHRVTHLYVHPTIFAKKMLQYLDGNNYDLSSIKKLQWTAGHLPEFVRNEIFKRFPKIPFEVTYGMTEASNIASFEYLPNDPSRSIKASCVGYPLPGAGIRIVNDHGIEVPRGVTGEVEIFTPTAFMCYLGDVGSSQQSITKDGWFHTGDTGHLDEHGALHLDGRTREIINTGGMSVQPAEVENAIAEHEQVIDVIVFGMPHPEWDEAITAVLTLKEPNFPNIKIDLMAFCRQKLAAYKLPKNIYVIDELPRNASGKIDKKRVIEVILELKELVNQEEQ